MIGSFFDIVNCPEIRERLQQLATYHPESYHHSLRVGQSMFELSGLLQMAPETPTRAGLLHDFGKLWIPLHVLDKGSQLTEKERFIMEGHTRFGAVALDTYDRAMAEVAGGHHEFQRSPYARESPRNESELIQLVALADHSDALSHPRVYRNGGGYTFDESMKIIEGLFTGDPVLMRAFFDVAPHLPSANIC